MLYLDNAATTKPMQCVVDTIIENATNFGNPSSLHSIGLDAEKMIEISRKTIANMLGVKDKDIYFTSGGTEANNMAIFGAAYGLSKIGKSLITTQIEHPSVLECFKRLEKEGFDVTYLKPDKDGIISLDELEKSITPKTTLVSVMHVNNETGVIQPVDKIKEILNKEAPRAFFHCDCVQSFGKIPVSPVAWGADMVSISSHKIGGFKGTGALYISKPQLIKPLIVGGEQQKEIRPGTENTLGICAFAKACENCNPNVNNLKEFRNKLAKRIQSAICDTQINGSNDQNSGSVLNMSFLGVKAEVLLHALENNKIYVSTGSACSSHKPQPSHVLQAMDCDKKAIHSAIRMSFIRELNEDEIETLINALKKEVDTIRRYM